MAGIVGGCLAHHVVSTDFTSRSRIRGALLNGAIGREMAATEPNWRRPDPFGSPTDCPLSITFGSVYQCADSNRNKIETYRALLRGPQAGQSRGRFIAEARRPVSRR